jgi:hypothetical protein
VKIIGDSEIIKDVQKKITSDPGVAMRFSAIKYEMQKTQTCDGVPDILIKKSVGKPDGKHSVNLASREKSKTIRNIFRRRTSEKRLEEFDNQIKKTHMLLSSININKSSTFFQTEPPELIKEILRYVSSENTTENKPTVENIRNKLKMNEKFENVTSEIIEYSINIFKESKFIGSMLSDDEHTDENENPRKTGKPRNSSPEKISADKQKIYTDLELFSDRKNIFSDSADLSEFHQNLSKRRKNLRYRRNSKRQNPAIKVTQNDDNYEYSVNEVVSTLMLKTDPPDIIRDILKIISEISNED